jgi:hypothetical protein
VVGAGQSAMGWMPLARAVIEHLVKLVF